MARPKKYKFDCERISLYLSNDKIAMLNKLCLKKGLNRNELVNTLISREYESEEKKMEREADEILNEHLDSFVLSNQKLDNKNGGKLDS